MRTNGSVRARPPLVAPGTSAAGEKSVAVYLLPKGAPLSTAVAPSPPATGSGGNLPGMPSTGAGGAALRVPTLAVALALGGFLLVAGWGLRYRARRG